jgi:PadR family transcriptional regulator PadR
MRGRHGRRRGHGGPGISPRRIRGFVEPATLLLLLRDSTHGYGLLDQMAELGFGDYPVDPSAIYRTLRQLEMEGMVTSRWDPNSVAGPPKRVYDVTEAGRRYLASWVEELRVTDRILHRFLEIYDEHLRGETGKGGG